MERISTCFGVPNSCCSLSPFGHLSSIGRMGSRLEGGGKSSFALSEKRNISAALRRRKRVSLWPPSLPLPIFFRRKEEERVEWGGEYQHQMLLRLLLQLQPHNDGYLIDNLPPSDSSERVPSPNGNFAAFACVTVHLPRGGGGARRRRRRSFHSASQTERWENNGAGGEMKVGEYGPNSWTGKTSSLIGSLVMGP